MGKPGPSKEGEGVTPAQVEEFLKKEVRRKHLCPHAHAPQVGIASWVEDVLDCTIDAADLNAELKDGLFVCFCVFLVVCLCIFAGECKL